MKASKFVVLVGGILGIIAFFLPLVTVERQGTKVSVSAFQTIKGLDEVQSAVNSDAAKTNLGSTSEGRRSLKETDDTLGKIKGLVLAVFAPALLLALIGGIAVKRKQFGRLGGTFSLLLGLLSLGVGALLKSAAEGDGGIGITILLLTGIAGVVGGLMALVKPERLATPARV